MHELLRAIRKTDNRVFGAVARRHAPWLDRGMLALTRSANHSKLWMLIAAGLSFWGGRRGMRAALRGLGSIAVTSAIVNLGVKRFVRRPRPSLRHVPAVRHLSVQPATTSFPSGHAASAFAFAVGVGSELPGARLPLTLLASAVASSRVYVGVHYPLDVAVGAALGAGVAYASRTPVPVLPKQAGDEPVATESFQLEAAARGAGVAVVVNRTSGSAMGALDIVRPLLAEARIVEIERPEELTPALERAASDARVLGICGGDGSVGAAAHVAMRCGRPLLVIPGGTLNHLARDLRIESPEEAVEALERGEGVRIDVGELDGGLFVNTATLGGHARMIDVSEALQRRIGRWPAHFIATLRELVSATPVTVTLDGRERTLWMAYIGNCRHEPAGFGPTWRPRLDDGLLDVRLLSAEVRLSRMRLLLALLTGRLTRCRAYEQSCERRLRVDPRAARVTVTRDGDAFEASGPFDARKHERALAVYTPARPAASQAVIR